MAADPFLTFGEAARMLGGERPLGRRLLNDLVAQGHLRDNGLAHKARRLTRASVLALIHQIEQGAAPWQRGARRTAKGGIYDDPQRPGRKIVKVPDGHGGYIRRRAVDAAAAEAKYREIQAELSRGQDARGASRTLQQLVLEWREKVFLHRHIVKRGEEAGLSDDVDAYDLILKDKESLLSFPSAGKFPPPPFFLG